MQRFRASIAVGLIAATLGWFSAPLLVPFVEPPVAKAVGGYSASNVLGPDNFTNAADWTNQESTTVTITEMVYDATGKTIYGAGTSGIDRRCFDEGLSTACADDSAWAQVLTTPDMGAIALDTGSGARVLYAGGLNGRIYRCDIAATSCDASGDWSQVYDIGSSYDVQAFAINDGVLFIGTEVESSTTIIGRCTLSSGCDESGDFNFGFANLNERITSMVVDSANDILYAGFNASPGMIRRCNQTSTSCDEDTDWVNVVEPSSQVLSFTIDTDNSVVYAGNETQVLRCVISSGCDASGEWVTSFTSSRRADGLIWDPTTDAVYSADNDSSNFVFQCLTATSCDTDGDWHKASEKDMTAFVRDTTTGYLYMAGENSGSPASFRCDPANGCNDRSEIGSGPRGFAYDSSGQRLFVVDSSADRVLVYNLAAITNGEAPVNVLGQADLNDESGCNRGGSAAANTLCGPRYLAYDSSGQRLFVSDSSNNRVLTYDVAAITDGEDAVNVLGQGGFTGSSCPSEPGASDICAASGLAYDSGGQRLFVASSDNGDVKVFNLADGLTDGEAASWGVGGNSDLSPGGCVSPPSAEQQSGLCSPMGIAYDSTGQRLFVSDSSNNRVMVWDVASITNDEQAVNVLGQASFAENGSATTAAGLSTPEDVTFGGSSRLYVADKNNSRIIVYDVAAITDGEDAVDVIGQSDFTTSDTGTTASTLNQPQGVLAGAAGSDVIVSDSSNSRALFFSLSTSSGGGSRPDIATFTGFVPRYIRVQQDAGTTADRNVLLQVGADVSANFSGTVDVLISNTPDFTTFSTYRYVMPDPQGSPWPKTIGWDLCLGIPGGSCNPGRKTVYARFYVNLPPVQSPLRR